MNCPAPIGFYTNHEQNPLIFHLLNVGEGLMSLIVFPNRKTMLFDCNVTGDNEEEILTYLGENLPSHYDSETKTLKQWIDVFVNSHRDEDHYRGLSKINATFKIKSIWDSGQTGGSTQSADYEYYMSLRRTLRSKYGENAVIIPVPSKQPILSYGEAEVYCLNSSQEYKDNQESALLLSSYEQLVENDLVEAAKIQHTNAIVLSIRYQTRSILLASDSDWQSWKDQIVPNFGQSGLLESTILVASHHGSRSFFTDEKDNEHIDIDENPETTYLDSIYYIKPSITLISCGEYDSAHHPNKEAMDLYKESTSNEQVYTTYEKHALVGFIDKNGHWTLTPTRLVPKTNISNNIKINCTVDNNGYRSIGKSGDDFPIGCNLKFSISSKSGMLEPYNELSVWFEVSNGGIGDHNDHQEIYYKDKNEKGLKTEFSRDVSFEGRHLLRCRIKNRKKKIYATQVFIVNGIR